VNQPTEGGTRLSSDDKPPDTSGEPSLASVTGPGVRSRENAVIYFHEEGTLSTLIEKDGAELRLKLLGSESGEWQSRIDLNAPHRLMCPFMEIMLLALLWHPNPSRVHVLGLGGGNMPTWLRRSFPTLEIDCTEINPDVCYLAQTYFGFKSDDRLHVHVTDGRAFLESRPADAPYDIIFLDAFVGVGFSPLRLGTTEFLMTCKAQLSPEGLVVVNLLPQDPLVAERLAALHQVFRSVYFSHANGALVFFVHDSSRVSVNLLQVRAAELQLTLPIDFPYFSLAQTIGYLPRPAVQGSTHPPGLPLTDATPPDSIPLPEAIIKSLAPDSDCPCGSGLKYAKCHGFPRVTGSEQSSPQ